MQKIRHEIAERESTLASDTAKITEVLHDLVEGYLSKQHPVPEILVLMQPTSPFVAQEHLAKCILKLREDPSPIRFNRSAGAA